MNSIKEFRIKIDSFINSTKYLRPSREVSLVHTNLQRSFMWLGEALKETGSQSPYVNSENPSNAVIEPTAEHTEHSLSMRWEEIEQTHTARVKDFRSIIQETVDAFKAYRKSSESAGKDYDDCLNNSFQALKESKMWLGWELARIKKEIEGQGVNEPQSPLPL